MNMNLDPEKFEEHQAIFVRDLVEIIRVKLHESGLTEAKLEEATASIAFSVASMIDDNSAIEADGVDVHPYLTFRTSDDALTHCGENSYTHEFVYDELKRLFEA